MEIAVRSCTKKYVCLKYIGKILEKNLSFHGSGDSSSATTDIGGAFSIWPNITLVPANHYPKLWGNAEPLNFLIFFQLITVN